MEEKPNQSRVHLFTNNALVVVVVSGIIGAFFTYSYTLKLNGFRP